EVGAGAAVEIVRVVIAVDGVAKIRPDYALDRNVAITRRVSSVARRRHQIDGHRGTGAVVERVVVAAAAIENVGSGAAGQSIIAAAASDMIVAAATVNEVSPGPAIEIVRIVIAVDDIAEIRADHT